MALEMILVEPPALYLYEKVALEHVTEQDVRAPAIYHDLPANEC
jgi:hypothetical protein